VRVGVAIGRSSVVDEFLGRRYPGPDEKVNSWAEETPARIMSRKER
jgi:hypothetical protein